MGALFAQTFEKIMQEEPDAKGYLTAKQVSVATFDDMVKMSTIVEDHRFDTFVMSESSTSRMPLVHSQNYSHDSDCKTVGSVEYMEEAPNVLLSELCHEQLHHGSLTDPEFKQRVEKLGYGISNVRQDSYELFKSWWQPHTILGQGSFALDDLLPT